MTIEEVCEKKSQFPLRETKHRLRKKWNSLSSDRVRRFRAGEHALIKIMHSPCREFIQLWSEMKKGFQSGFERLIHFWMWMSLQARLGPEFLPMSSYIYIIPWDSLLNIWLWYLDKLSLDILGISVLEKNRIGSRWNW